jgi:uncharacterized protein (UPF0332 family)
MDDASIFLAKAEASLAGAESELLQGRFDNCANRSYYACFQAAIAALIQAGFGPSAKDGEWSHAAVQAQFVGELINRRKRFPASLRSTLGHNMDLGHDADYDSVYVSEIQARRSVHRSRDFVAAVRERREGGR